MIYAFHRTAAVALVLSGLSGTPQAAPLPAPLLAAIDLGVSTPALPVAPALTPLVRVGPPDYADGFGSLAGPNRPAPRALSNALSNPAHAKVDAKPLSNLAVAMLQLMASHEIARSPTNNEVIDMSVDPGDPFISGSGQSVIPQNRSVHAGGSGAGDARQQLNDVTAAFDASTVYGSDSTTTAQLRTFTDGKMKIAANGDLPVINGRVKAGDVRADENPTLQALHGLFVREHNRLADDIKSGCPGCTDEEIFNGARVVVAQMQQKVFYDELMPVFLGSGDLASFVPDKSKIPASGQVVNAFTAAAGRTGHSQVPNDILLKLPGLPGTRVDLKDCFFDAACQGGASQAEILYGAAFQASQPIDGVVTSALRNAQVPGFGSPILIDLLATNINRGRDHGLLSYEALRLALGFPATPLDSLLPAHVLQAYAGSGTDGIDLLVGIFTEVRGPGDYLGETGKALWGLQFEALKDTAPLFPDMAQDALDAWFGDFSMAWLLARDTGIAAKKFGASPFLADVAPVPLPPALGLFAGALAGLCMLRRRRSSLT